MKKTVLVITVAFCSFASFAQQKENAQDNDSSLKEIQLNVVTVAATKFPVNTNNIAQQVLVLNARKMQFLNQQTTAEMLTHTGNVFVQKSQLGGGSPVIRGFEANKILIVVDGVRMNNAVFRGGHLQNVITMDNTILDKTEILFGPSSTMYGSDALGGVLSFTTKNPTLSATEKDISNVNAFVRYASAYNEKTGHVDFGFGSKKFASLTSFTYSDFGDLTTGSKTYSKFPTWGMRPFYVQRINGVDSQITNSNPKKQVQTNYKQYDVLQKFLFQTGKVQNIFNIQFSTSSDIFRYDRLTEATGAGVARSSEWYYGPQKRLLAAWQMVFAKSKWFDKGQMVTAFQDIEESRHNRNFKSTKLNHRIEHINVYSWNADFNKNYAKGDVRYGAEVVLNKVGSKAYFDNISNGQAGPLDTRYPDGGSNTQSYALYIANTHYLADNIILNDGLRFTQNRLHSEFIDKTFFPFPFDDVTQNSSALTGNLGLVVLPKGGWKVSFVTSTGFRTPNVDDMVKVFESVGGSLIVPNPDLKPERTWNFELGLNKTFAGRYRAGVTLWSTNYSNALTTDFGTLNGSSTVIYNGTPSTVKMSVNKAKAYVWGVNGAIGADITPNISFSSVINYTYGRIKETTGKYPLDHVPPMFGKTSVTGHFGKFTGEVFALYNSAKDSADYNLRGEDNQVYSADMVRGYTPSWFTANFRAALEINQHATIQFAVENITDKFYRVFASGLSAPGRNFVITLRGKL